LVFMAKQEKKSEKKAVRAEKAKAETGTGKKETTKSQTHKEKHAKRDKKTLRLQRLLKRKHLPIFRGRFGVKSIRKKSIEKWQKWRKSRGEDTQRNQEDGAIPNSGYRTNREIRFLHPSGYREVMVRNLNEAKGLKDCIARIAAGIGKKKKKLIIEELKKNNLRIAN